MIAFDEFAENRREVHGLNVPPFQDMSVATFCQVDTLESFAEFVVYTHRTDGGKLFAANSVLSYLSHVMTCGREKFQGDAEYSSFFWC
jgi:hypothetical protein